MAQLNVVKKILTKATSILSDNLQPIDLLRSLKAKEALKPSEVTKIKSKTTTEEQVDMLLEMLQKKPISAYETFMEVLAEERGDLHEQVKKIEVELGYKSESGALKQMESDTPSRYRAGRQNSITAGMVQISDSDIRDVTRSAKLTNDQLKVLFDVLGLEAHEIENAEESANTKDSKLKAASVLRHWRQINGSNATRMKILDALEESDLKNAMQILKTKWEGVPHPTQTQSQTSGGRQPTQHAQVQAQATGVPHPTQTQSQTSGGRQPTQPAQVQAQATGGRTASGALHTTQRHYLQSKKKTVGAATSGYAYGESPTTQQHRHVEPDSLDLLEPDNSGSYEVYHIQAASAPTEYQLNPEKCYVELLQQNSKGLAYILNIKSFSGRQNIRKGSLVDFKNMQHLFRELGYKIFANNELSAEEIQTSLDDFVSQFSPAHASSVVVLMSHGDDGVIYGTDGKEVQLTKIMDKFSPSNCPALKGKPKMFFIQACRGGAGERPVEADAAAHDSAVNTNLDYESYKDTVTKNSDFYIAYAATTGCFSLRDVAAGSWFVQAIVEAFLENAHKESLHQLMNQVTRMVTQQKGALYDLQTRRRMVTTQTPRIEHSLRKDVYFLPVWH